MDNNNYHNPFPPTSEDYPSSSRIYSTNAVPDNDDEQAVQRSQNLEDLSLSFNPGSSLNPGTSYAAADTYTTASGQVDPSEAEKQAMEIIGITPTTFSSNIQFRVPRLMQESFDPALLHSTRGVTSPAEATTSLTTAYTSSNDNYTTSGYYVPPSALVPYYPTHNTGAGAGSSNHNSVSQASGTRPGQKPSRSSAALALNGLPIYSASGFDMLDILARIATRPNPKVALGPVDMTCAFLVVDITREDCPIIYASQTFTELTGYSEEETLGRNCRFLQAPPGVTLEKGSKRDHTDIESVTTMAQHLALNREVQVTLVNYKKSGEAFINCVTVIPVIPYDHRPGASGGNGSASEPVRYHVGFQVDLAVQPHAIMKSVQNGSYVTNYSSTPLPPVLLPPSKLNMRALTKDMTDVISRMDHLLTTSVTAGPEAARETTSEGQAPAQDRTKLSMALLAYTPDPIFVVSLKGTFLYVSPSISRLLQYPDDWFLGKNLADICHPDDLAPTMRNVKESTSATPTGTGMGTIATAAMNGVDVQLLYRGRRKDGGYVWLDCSGKLHADTSRGRKALLLRLRNVDLPRITWDAVTTPAPSSSTNSTAYPYHSSTAENADDALGGVSKDECYLRIARDERGLIVSCPPYIPPSARGVESILGRKACDVVGKELSELVVDDARGTKKEAIRVALADACSVHGVKDNQPQFVFCNMPATATSRKAKGKKGKGKEKVVLATVEITFFPPKKMSSSSSNSTPTSSTKEAADEKMSPDGEVLSKNVPMTIIARLRVLQRRTMRTGTSEPPTYNTADPEQSYGDTYSAKASMSTSSFTGLLPITSPATYNPATGELSAFAVPPMTGFVSNPMEQLQSPVQMFHQGNIADGSGSGPDATSNNGGRRSKIYSVRVTGDVNAISDGVTSSNSNVSESGSNNPISSNNSTGSPNTNLSWQYELQQLRMQNEKMRLEVDTLEKDQRAKRKERNASSQSQSQHQSQGQQPHHQTQYIFENPRQRHSGQTPSQYVRQQQQQQQAQQQHQQSQQRLREHRRKKSLGQQPQSQPQPSYVNPGPSYFSSTSSTPAPSSFIAPGGSRSRGPSTSGMEVDLDPHSNSGNMDWGASASGSAYMTGGGMAPPPHLNLSMPPPAPPSQQHQQVQSHTQQPYHGMDGSDAGNNPQNTMHEWSQWGH